MSTRRKEATSVVDNKQEVHLPLDYSFKAVSHFPELLREKPRTRGHQAVLVLEDELSASDSTDSIDITKSYSMSFKANNNMLAGWEDFMQVVCKLFVDPVTRLGWLDLSFNDLKSIDTSLLELPNLTMLYLHGNNISKMSEVDKLSALPRLKTLALHGNPIEVTPGYHHYVLSRIPQLQTLDFSGVTKADRATAQTWSTMIAPKPRTKKHKSTE